MSQLTAAEIIRLLSLEPLREEGGWFRETYRSEESVAAGSLPARYGSDRCFSTTIYYLITPESFSALHQVKSDEGFHFYLGDPVEMLQLWPDGTSRTLTIGTDLAAGMHPQVTVPKGVWQGTRLLEGGKVALMGTTVAPGFDPRDFQAANRLELIRHFPDCADAIRRFTRE